MKLVSLKPFFKPCDDQTRNISFSHEWTKYPSSLFEIDPERKRGTAWGRKSRRTTWLPLRDSFHPNLLFRQHYLHQVHPVSCWRYDICELHRIPWCQNIRTSDAFYVRQMLNLKPSHRICVHFVGDRYDLYPTEVVKGRWTSPTWSFREGKIIQRRQSFREAIKCFTRTRPNEFHGEPKKQRKSSPLLFVVASWEQALYPQSCEIYSGWHCQRTWCYLSHHEQFCPKRRRTFMCWTRKGRYKNICTPTLQRTRSWVHKGGSPRNGYVCHNAYLRTRSFGFKQSLKDVSLSTPF